MAKRSVIITNASTPIGQACARRFSGEGDRLVLVDKNEEAGRSISDELAEQGRETVFVAADCAEKLDVHNVLAEAIENDSTIDVLIHNQITFSDTPFSKLTSDEFDACFTADVRSGFLMTQSVMKQMVKSADPADVGGMQESSNGRSIIFLLAANASLLGDAAFSTAQGAVSGLISALAVAGSRHGIRANGICVGAVKGAFGSDERLKELSKTSLLSGRGDPVDVAELAYFLSSPFASYITGKTMELDGGGLLKPTDDKYGEV